MAVGLRNPEIIPDDQVLAFGTHRDIVGLNRASTLAADTALTGVLIGTPESQAIAANSLILSNITASGDIALYTNKGGNSQMGLWLDGSSGDVAMLAASGASVDWYIAGVKEMDYATGAMAFQQATTLSTTTGVLTIDGDDGIVLQTTGTGSIQAKEIVIVGTGEGGTTAATGLTLRAPDIVTGGAGNVDGADLTIIAGLGTGIGDVGTIIIRTPRVAATGDNIQTLTTLLTLDANTVLVEGGAALKSDSATEIGIQVANGALTVGTAGSLVAPYAGGTPTAFTDGIGGNLNGALGINYDTGGLVSTLEARSNGAWVSVALTGALFQNRLQFAPMPGVLYHPDQLVRGEPWTWKDGMRLDTYMDESRCLRCGQPIEVGQDAVFTVNGATGRGVHAIYSHFACALKARGKQLVAASEAT